jgi:hypothetical protein
LSLTYQNSPYSAIPNPASKDFIDDWLPDFLAYRETIDGYESWPIVYVDQGGGGGGEEVTGSGTISDPYLCPDAATLQTHLDTVRLSYPNGLRFAIKAGTVWQVLSGRAIVISQAKVSVEKYGTGNNPLFHGTETLDELGVAGLGSPTAGVYTMTLGSSEMSGKTFGFLLPDWGSSPRGIASLDYSYRRRATALTVTGAGQFHYDTVTRVLTLYPLASATLTTAGFRVVTHSAASLSFVGLVMSEDYDETIIDSIDVIGTYGNAATEVSADQFWCFITYADGTNRHVLKNCMGIYGGYHSAGSYTNSTGGFCLIKNCILGLCKHYRAIPITFYAFGGDNEGYSWGNTLVGMAANELHSTVINRASQPIYSHTNGGVTQRVSLFISYGDYIWSGLLGYNARPYCSPPANTGTWFSSSNNSITNVRAFIVGMVMDGGTNFVSRDNTQNLVKILGSYECHAYINCLHKNFYWHRDTAGGTVYEYSEISTTDYNFGGYNINCIWHYLVGATNGNFNFGLVRNNLSGGTEPDRQGVIEDQNWYCTMHFEVPVGFAITGTWNAATLQQNGTYDSVTPAANNGPMRKVFINSSIIWNSAAAATEDLVLGIPEANPNGSLFSVAGSSLRGGIGRSAFYRCSTAHAQNGNFRSPGTTWFKDNTRCFDLTSAPSLLGRPDTDSELVVRNHFPLHSSSSGQDLEYDFYGNRRVTNGALGAIEATFTNIHQGSVADYAMIRGMRVLAYRDTAENYRFSMAFNDALNEGNRTAVLGGIPITIFTHPGNGYSLGVYKWDYTELTDLGRTTVMDGYRYKLLSTPSGTSNMFVIWDDEDGGTDATGFIYLGGCPIVVNANNAIVATRVEGAIEEIGHAYIGGMPLVCVRINSKWYLAITDGY